MSAATVNSPANDQISERFLEDYNRQIASLCTVAETLCCLKEMLACNVTIDLPLSASGRAGLAHIIGLVADETMNACGSFPSSCIENFAMGERS